MALTEIGFLDAGIPKTDAERASAHYGIPVEEVDTSLVSTLPPRGTGLAGINDIYAGLKAWQWGLLVVALSGFVYFMYMRRK